MTGSAGPGSHRGPTAAAPANDPLEAVAWALPGNLPPTIEPMRAAPSPEPFDSSSHVFEIIWDGIRALLFLERGEARIQDGYGRDVSALYPDLTAAASDLSGSGVVLDGAIVCLDTEGRPDFARLHSRLSESKDHGVSGMADHSPVTFQAFDILYRNGLSVMAEPLRRRKTLLRQAVRRHGTLAIPDFVEREGIAFFEAARAHGLPGIVAKDRDSRYISGARSRSWLTMRVYERDKFVIGGYTFGHALRPGRPTRTGVPFNSLLLGQYDTQGALHFAGSVEGPFDAGIAEEIVRRLDSLASPESPFAGPTPEGSLTFWCRPELVAVVRHAGRNASGTLRFPLFDCLRPDVPASACRIQEITP